MKSTLLWLAVLGNVCACGLCPFGVGDCVKGAASTSTSPSQEKLHMTVSVAAVLVGERAQFKAAGGRPPYRYSVVSGGGYIGPTDGLFVAALPTGMTTVRATDNENKYTEAVIIIQGR